MRHAIANLLYRIASRLDRLEVRRGYMDEFGDKRSWTDHGDTHPHTSTLVHLRDGTPIRGSFNPAGDYAALQIGDSNEATIFLNRESLHKLFTVLREFERRYRDSGEGRPL